MDQHDHVMVGWTSSRSASMPFLALDDDDGAAARGSSTSTRNRSAGTPRRSRPGASRPMGGEGPGRRRAHLYRPAVSTVRESMMRAEAFSTNSMSSCPFSGIHDGACGPVRPRRNRSTTSLIEVRPSRHVRKPRVPRSVRAGINSAAQSEEEVVWGRRIVWAGAAEEGQRSITS